ncbi:MAG: hypothetical protein ACPGWR_30380 [Ardenticatenaceae bacterium]
MNELLQNYVMDTQHPAVSGIEHLQMLHNRSKLAEMEAALTAEECQQLVAADLLLVFYAKEFWAELSHFIDLAQERHRLNVTKQQWWWYLDIIAQLPGYLIKQPKRELVFA